MMQAAPLGCEATAVERSGGFGIGSGADFYAGDMNSERRARLALVGIGVVAAALCWFIAYLLPEGGFLGFVASVFKFVAGLILFSLPMPIWKVIAPATAERWESSGGRPVPLISPVIFWIATAVFAWILLQAEPPVAGSDYAAAVFLWCACGGIAAFAVWFTRMYIRDRRGMAK